MASSIPILLFLSVLLILLSTLSTCSKNFAWNHSPSAISAPNCDFPNNDIGKALVPEKDCAEACRRFPGCTHFAWWRRGGGTCFFKYKASITTASAIPNSSSGSVCGILSSLQGSSENFASNYSLSIIWARTRDVHNSDLNFCLVPGDAPVPGKECSAACERAPGCTHFAWTRHGGGTCWFNKGGITTHSARSPNSLSGKVCGILNGSSGNFAWNYFPSVVWAPNCDLPNYDIGSAHIPEEDCAEACRRFPRCTHFAWWRGGGNVCLFKHKAGITIASAIPRSSPGWRCGILKGSAGNFAWNYLPSVVWAPNCDLPSYDIGSAHIPEEDCAEACRRFPRCTHFAWWRGGGSVCLFKHKEGITTASAIHRSSPGWRCGILKVP